jgi:hypothetical protein
VSRGLVVLSLAVLAFLALPVAGAFACAGEGSPAGSAAYSRAVECLVNQQRAAAAGWSGRTLGETIGWGAGELATPSAIVSGWMNSPPHREILLGGEFRKVGLGVANGSPGGFGGAATVTADFGG